VVFWAEVASALASALELALDSAVCVGWAEVHLFLCVSSTSADSLQCHFGKEGIRLSGLTKHSWVSSYHSLHLDLPRKLNTPLLPFSDLGTWFDEQILRFLYCGVLKPAFGHFGHVHGQADVGLLQLYTTSLPCHHCRHVEYLQEISCCFKHCDAAMT
jgi:hypothetical protein